MYGAQPGIEPLSALHWLLARFIASSARPAASLSAGEPVYAMSYGEVNPAPSTLLSSPPISSRRPEAIASATAPRKPAAWSPRPDTPPWATSVGTSAPRRCLGEEKWLWSSVSIVAHSGAIELS